VGPPNIGLQPTSLIAVQNEGYMVMRHAL